MPSPRTILHVTECYGGGVESMIRRYASVAPDARHVLLWVNRRGMPGDPHAAGLYDAIRDLPATHPAAIATVARTVREVQPDLIHAHSSFAGVYARVACGLHPRWRGRVAYTPHGLAVENHGKSRAYRFVFAGVEAAMAPFGGIAAACSMREAEVLRRLNPIARRHPIPNGLVGGEIPQDSWAPADSPEVVIAARISPERRPALFADVAESVRAERPAVRFTWIGDGAPELRAILEDAGVTVTGWAGRPELLRRMTAASVYLHCATQDGFPVSVLEAMAVGMPILVPEIPAFAECPVEARYTDAADAAGKLLAALAAPGANRGAWEPLRQARSPRAFAAAVRDLYGLPADADPATPTPGAAE